jgi:hypothetical protein
MQMSGSREGRRIGWQHVDQRITGLLRDPARRKIVLLVKQLNTLQGSASDDADEAHEPVLLARAVRRIAATGRRIQAAGGATRTRVRDRSRSAGKRAHAIAARLELRGAQAREEAQATRRVSLHDADARPIAKGRLGKPVEFGYKAQVTDNDSSTT